MQNDYLLNSILYMHLFYWVRKEEPHLFVHQI